MGCKGDINDLSDKLNAGFNRNIMGCKEDADESLLSQILQI